MFKKTLVSVIALSLFPASALADRHQRESHSHRGAWIAGAAVVGGLIGYAIANDKSPAERRSNIKAYCENRVPERYAYSRRLTKEWVKGCMQRTEEELDARAEEAYNDGYTG